MTRSVNLYSLSRINQENTFNIIKDHQTQNKDGKKTGYREIESLRLLVDCLFKNEVTIREMDDFYFGYTIPQIGKEFDLLSFSDLFVLNIELKSQMKPKEELRGQLLKNRHYLKHLGKDVILFTVVTDSITCFQLTENDELVQIDFLKIVKSVKERNGREFGEIDNLFHVSQYLVSPLNTPEKFIAGEYFLTQQQEQFKREIIKMVSEPVQSMFIHLTGDPGTGKTLLLYDLAKAFAERGPVLIVHCAKLSDGQRIIKNTEKSFSIISANQVEYEKNLANYKYILVDEVQRIYPDAFNMICNTVRQNQQVCVFSSDPKQVLSHKEMRRNIVQKIKKLPVEKEMLLSEKIRTNKEVHSFVRNMFDMNKKSKIKESYQNIELAYANTTAEAQNLLEYYRDKGYIFINFSKSNYHDSPYSQYHEDYDTHHIIGQEFDNIVILLDQAFYYNAEGVLCAYTHPNPDYIYKQLLYQGLTRGREKLAIIVIDNLELFEKMSSILNNGA